MRVNKVICDICKKEIDPSNERWMIVKVSNTSLRPEYEVHEECFLRIFGDLVAADSAEKDISKEVSFVDCPYYHVQQYSPVDEDPRYECWGTREREECTCSGNKYNCNFHKYNPKTDKFEDI